MSDMSINSTPSGMTGSGGGDKLRIVGMATGLDVDGIIQKMVRPQQLRISNEKIKLQQIQWKQEAYRDIIKDIKGFQDEFFNVAKSASMVNRADNYSVYTTESDDPNIATAFASSSAIEGSYEINVTNLAKQAEIKSREEITVGTDKAKAKLTTKLSEIGVTADGTIEINGKPISISKDDTLLSFTNKVRNGTEGKVNAVYDEISGNIFFRTSGTGTDSKIEITDSSNIILTKFHIDHDSDGKVDASGKNAKFEITSPYGGESLKVTDSQTNVYSVNGLTISLGNKEETKDDTGTTIPAKTTITVKPDDDAPVKMIKDFIGKYNDLVDKIQSKLTEKSNKDYKPLTDEQKKQMSKDEIASWEAKAKEGILRSDPMLTQMMTSIRRAFFDKVEGAGISFGKDLGLDTSSGIDENNKFVSSESGKILFTIGGEEKLKETIKTHRKEVMNLFTKTSDSTDPAEKYKNQGIFSRINDILIDYTGMVGTTLNSAKLTSMANKQNNFSSYGTGLGNTFPDQIQRQNVYINKLTDKMAVDQERYYKQFSALETAMQRLNAQSAWLYQQYGGQ